MTRPKLHLDADTSIKALQKALTARGHDVTRMPTVWMPLAAQQSWSLTDLTAALDRLLSATEAGDLNGQVRWLNQWRR